jgi:LPXTG-site transpeptidase (sortase) family protein
VAQKTATSATFGLPVRLLIPKLGVDTNITYMGLTKSGDMDVPPDLVNVGWYKYGTKPGEVGSAVIAGHLEGTKDLGVFIGLDKLQPGDLVKIRNDRDEIIEFIVRDKHTYKQDERPSEIFNSSDGSHLNLITCTGVWSNAQQRYSHRLVVFTDKK